MRKLIFVIIAFVFAGKGFGVFAQEEIQFTGNNNFISVSHQVYTFNDKSGNLAVENIISDTSIHFSKSKQQIPSYSFTNSAIWCKFIINNGSKQQLYLEIAPPILNEVYLYQIKNNKVVDSVSAGSFFSNKLDNTIESSNYNFEIDAEADYYLLKVKSKTRLFIKAHLGSYLGFIEKNNLNDAIQGIYAGMILMIFIYHIFLYFSTREKVYLFYSFHLINTGIFFLYMSGIGIKSIWFNLPILNSYFISIISFGYILTLLFITNFLDSRKNLPIINKLIFLCGALLFVNGIIDLAGFSNISGPLLNYIGLLVIIPIIAGATSLIRRGFKPAYTFLSAWVLYIVGVGIQTLQSLNYIPTNEFTSNTIQIGSSIEIILLAIAVGNKLNFYKQGKLVASKGANKLLQENEALKENQIEQLEERYQKQTELLYEKNKELKRLNKEINLKFEEISIQNMKIQEFHELLETKNKIITKQNDELVAHKENLEQLIEERTWELQEATRLAEESDQLKTAFLKDFSHELRTPMNAIAGFSSLLMDVDVEDKSFDYYTGIIVDNTDNLLELVDNIIDLSRLQSNELSLKKVRFDLSKMFYALKDRFAIKLKKEKKSFIELIVDVPQGNAQRVMLDYNRVWKIAYQLIDNSVKYTETGFIKFGYKPVEGANSIEIFVIDTGIGIKKEKLDVVFESFRKVEKNKLKLYSGTGVGLSLVKGLVKVMDGELFIDTISIDDYPDKNTGTSIRLVIPNALTQ